MKKSLKPRQLFVRSLSSVAKRGWLDLGYRRIPCVLGRSGRRVIKREGDGASPVGCMRLLTVYFRPDRERRPVTALPVRALRREDGWCDAPKNSNYNRPVQLPYSASAEQMWRSDGLYDLVVVIDYNLAPRKRNLGSAIFLHVAGQDRPPTEGCIAVQKRDLKRLLAEIVPGTQICI